jgi:hypothetical protein
MSDKCICGSLVIVAKGYESSKQVSQLLPADAPSGKIVVANGLIHSKHTASETLPLKPSTPLLAVAPVFWFPPLPAARSSLSPRQR